MMRPRVAAVPRIAGIIAVVALCSILAWSRVEAQSLKKLDVNVFPAGFILPLWVAQDKGFFARNGLQVRMIATPNSVQQMTGLINGQFDIAMTAVDNVIAYMEGQGEAPTRSTPDIVALMGSSSGFLVVDHGARDQIARGSARDHLICRCHDHRLRLHLAQDAGEGRPEGR